MSHKQLLYFADPMCSWCWGFSPVINQIHEKFAQTAPVIVYLGGLRAGNTRPMDQQQRMYILNHWFNVNEASGQHFEFKFKMPEGFIYNTEPACRAVKVIQNIIPDQTLAYFSAIQKSFYTKNHDVTQTDVLAALASDFGLSAEQFDSAFNSDELRQQTLNDFMLSQQMGVNGFPTLIGQRDDDYVYICQGFQLFTSVEATINKWLEMS